MKDWLRQRAHEMREVWPTTAALVLMLAVLILLITANPGGVLQP